MSARRQIRRPEDWLDGQRSYDHAMPRKTERNGARPLNEEAALVLAILDAKPFAKLPDRIRRRLNERVAALASRAVALETRRLGLQPRSGRIAHKLGPTFQRGPKSRFRVPARSRPHARRFVLAPNLIESPLVPHMADTLGLSATAPRSPWG